MLFSSLKRVLQTFKNPIRYVGKDLEGNSFYESIDSASAFGRTKRTVKYHNLNEDAIWDYIGGQKRLPAQWSAWLSHTRRDPPSLDEIQLDHQRLKRLAQNVAMIEERERAERQYRLTSGAYEDQSPSAISTPPILPTPSSLLQEDTNDRPLDLRSRTDRPPLPSRSEPPPGESTEQPPPAVEDPWTALPDVETYKAQPWTPKAPVKRGGR